MTKHERELINEKRRQMVAILEEEHEAEQVAEFLKTLEELRKSPEERRKMQASWEKMTARESKKGPAGSMAAMFMKAVRF